MTHQILNSGYDDQAKVFSKGQGNFLIDTDGTHFVDMAMGAGSLIHGHANEQIMSKVSEQARSGTLFLQNNDKVQRLSEAVAGRIPEQLSRFVFCNTGSEATQRALRIARTITGKERIAFFSGGWHGMNEWTLASDGGRFENNSSSVDRLGVPRIISEHSVELAYNDDKCFSHIASRASELAAVIVEPVQGSNPQPAIKQFLQRLRKVCTDNGLLLIFDEVISGFRLASGGASELFAVTPDIASYGKVLGGGLPIGLVAINETVLQQSGTAFLTGGTFSANPLSCAAGLATLQLLDEQSYQRLDALGRYFRKHLNVAFNQAQIPFHADGVGSISRIYFTAEQILSRSHRDAVELKAEQQQLFRQLLWQKNVIWPVNGIICNSLSQDETLYDEVIAQIVYAASRIL